MIHLLSFCKYNTIILIIKTITRFFGVDRLLQLPADAFTDLLAEAVAQLGEGLVVEHAPDDAVVEGELGADVTAHAVGAALAVTDVEETQIRQDADIEHGGLFFLLQKYSFESNTCAISTTFWLVYVKI